jgi:hypothetical protein
MCLQFDHSQAQCADCIAFLLFDAGYQPAKTANTVRHVSSSPASLAAPDAPQCTSGIANPSKKHAPTPDRGAVLPSRISALSLFPPQIDRPVCPPPCIGRVPQPPVIRADRLRAGPAIRCMQGVPFGGARLPRLLLQARGLCDSEALKLTLEFLAQTIDVRRSAARSWRMRFSKQPRQPGPRTHRHRRTAETRRACATRQFERLLNATSD